MSAASAWDDAELDFRLAEFGFRRCDANVAGKSEFATAAQRKAVYHCDNRFRKIFNGVECAAAFHHLALTYSSHSGKFADVGPGDECFFARACDDDYADFFVAFEYAGAVRNVYLTDPGPPQVDSWMGQSVGHWEGDTFVVVSNGFNDQTWFDRAGNHHSWQMVVTERFTLRDRDHILYEATIEDPETFSRPWTIRLPLYRHVDENARLGQFKCVEYVEELMYGHLRKEPIR